MTARTGADPASLIGILTALVCLLAILKIVVALGAYLWVARQQLLDWAVFGIFLAQILVRLGSGGLLIWSGADDRRSLLLGVALLLTATAYANAGLNFLVRDANLFWARLLMDFRIDALMPYFFWRFARVFPQAFLTRAQDLLLDWVEWAMLSLGLLLILANLMMGASPGMPGLQLLDAANPTGAYQVLIYGASLASLGLLWYRTRTAREMERRRVRVFNLGLLISIAPPTLFIIATSLSSDLTVFVTQSSSGALMIPLMQAFVLAMPVLTAYAVLVERILPVHVLLRQTVRFSLGHGFVLLLILFPLLLFAYYLYALRAETLASLWQGVNGAFLILALGLSAWFFSQRHVAHHYLEALFFRAGYDANALLAKLASQCREADAQPGLVSAVRTAIEQALHPRNVHVLFNTGASQLHDPRGELADLPLRSRFGEFLDRFGDATPVDEVRPMLAGSESYWLEQANVLLLVPIRGRSSNSGVLLLGEKMSELPYTRADMNYLGLVADTAASAVSHLTAKDTETTRTTPCRMCLQCGLLRDDADACPGCTSLNWDTALLPKVLHGRYEVDRALAQGGMGVVFLARDISLERPVVLKTVVQASTDELVFIRDEARLMATLSHPHIATIYGFESFQSIPILVCEYLHNGTLQDVLRGGSLAPEEAVDIIRQVARALAYLHRRGIVHGDIKPDNIGFDAEESPKLLDFGLAGVSRADGFISRPEEVRGGTLAYMSPELVGKGQLDQRADLWALAVTLFEALHGKNPFAGTTPQQIIQQIQRSDEIMAAAPAPARDFFCTALAGKSARRPQTAARFVELLEQSL